MSNKEAFENIYNHFNSEEEEIEDHEFSQNENKGLKHQSTENVLDNYENKIKEKLSNYSKKKRRTRDEFGYFINVGPKEKEEKENSNSSINEEEINSNDNDGKMNSEEENSEKNINKNKNTLGHIDDNNKFIGDDIYEHIYEDKDEQEKNENSNNENLNNLEGEEFRMDSFRPKPTPDSPQFINNKIKNDEKELKNRNNNGYANFTETLKTKIEGNNLIKNTDDSINDKNIKNSINNHNSNVLSLGKLPNSINKETDDNGIKKEEEYEGKNSEDSERQKEEDFLMMEELKRKKYKEKLEKEKYNEQIKNAEDDNDTEDGKENVVDDEEEEEENAQIQYLRQLEEKRKRIKKYQEDLKYKKNINFKNNETNQNITNSNNIMNNKNNDLTNSNQIKDMSIKLLNNYLSEECNKNKIKNNDIENNKIINTNIELNQKNNEQKNKPKSKYNISRKKNNNKIFKKKPNIKKTGIKKFSSPPSRNTNHNNNIYSSNKNRSVSSFNINSIKINHNKNGKNSKISTNKKVNIIDFSKIKRKLYSSKKETKPKMKREITLPFLKSSPRPRPKKAVDYHEKYTFTPIINKKSKKFWEKRNKTIEKNMTPEKKKDNDNLDDYPNNKYSTPIGVLLYEDANNKKEKMKQICLTENNNIKLNANSRKMNKNSYNMVIERMNKKINNIINKHSTNDKLTILNIVQCLSDLNLINEIIKKNEVSELSIEQLKNIIKNIKERDNKKMEELEFIEQIWFKLNPSMDEYINSQIFFEFFKILFTCDYNDINNKIDELTKLIEDLLENNNDYEKNDDNFQNNKAYISPLRDKNLEENDLWAIPKLLKIFLKLKNDIKVYRCHDTEMKKKEISKSANEEEQKELTFEPDLSRSNYVFDKNSKYYYYNNKEKDFLNQTISNVSSKPKHDFNRTYERFMQEKKMQEKVLEKLREIKKQKELKKYTHQPKISQYPQKNKKRKSYLYNQKSGVIGEEKKLPVYERLYNMSKDKNTNKSRKSKAEAFDSGETRKNNNIILDKERIGSDKKKIKHSKINKSNVNKNNKKNKNIIESIFITIEIKLPNGELKPLKIYKDQNNTIDLINEFCEENGINYEDRKVIFNKVIQYKNAFFERNLNQNNNNINLNNNEDMDTTDNTNGNLSKNSNESNRKTDNEKLNEKYKSNNEINTSQINELKTVEDYITYKNK